ncbi:MAG: hypothetical protein WAV72_29605 [Bradyrhizobium sp.]
MQKIVFLVVFLSLASGSARAETVAATMTKWGLMGAWSVSCEAAAGKGTAAKLRYIAKPDGSVFHYRNFGDDSSSDKIKAARITPEDWLELKIFFREIAVGEQDRTFALKRIRTGVVQAMYNYNAKGDYSVKDGKFTGNGKDTPLQHKCD